MYQFRHYFVFSLSLDGAVVESEEKTKQKIWTRNESHLNGTHVDRIGVYRFIASKLGYGNLSAAQLARISLFPFESSRHANDYYIMAGVDRHDQNPRLIEDWTMNIEHGWVSVGIYLVSLSPLSTHFVVHAKLLSSRNYFRTKKNRKHFFRMPFRPNCAHRAQWASGVCILCSCGEILISSCGRIRHINHVNSFIFRIPFRLSSIVVVVVEHAIPVSRAIISLSALCGERKKNKNGKWNNFKDELSRCISTYRRPLDFGDTYCIFLLRKLHTQ